ncbi:chloride channel protein [Chloroflexota bacterium]
MVSRVRLILKRLGTYENTGGIFLAALIGVLAGLGAVGFRELIKLFQWIFFNRGDIAFDFLGEYYVILLPVLGALLFGPLIYFLAREASGEGPPEVMEATAVRGGRIRSRVAAIKALASSICIGSGGSVGREGPIVQIGASIGSTVGQWLRLPEGWVRIFVLCGAAGGISATFNAPLGGVMFALEVLQRRFIPVSLFYIVISSVVADVIAHEFVGTQPSFIIPEHFMTFMTSPWEILPYLVLGIVAGLVSVAFVSFFYKSEDFFGALRIPGYIKPVLGAIIVGIIGYHYSDIFGLGYGEGYGPGGISFETGDIGADKALLGQIGLGTLLALLALKMVATSATLGSGGSGGVFAPSLFIGSMIGGAFGIAVHDLLPGITSDSEAIASGSYALVGMGAFFAATARGPITAIILLFEMTRSYELMLPLMSAVVFSTLISRNINRESIYTLRLKRRGVDFQQREESDVLRTITVSKAMTRGFPTVLPSTPLSELLNEMHSSGHHGFPIVDERGDLCGVVALEDVEAAMSQKDPDLTAIDVATQSPIVAFPDQSVHDALAQFGGRTVGRIPVVDRSNTKKLLGVLRRHDIVRAYTKALKR